MRKLFFIYKKNLFYNEFFSHFKVLILFLRFGTELTALLDSRMAFYHQVNLLLNTFS